MVYPQTAQLSVTDLSKVKDLEKEIGVVLIAYNPTEYANLDENQVKELQKLEKNLNATVVAFR
ncbi:MAG: hypothetical protein SA339_04190 [Methanomassiliicoccus sp.]|nr:hypothetical protein [Methanomassiliicoccus sp.]